MRIELARHGCNYAPCPTYRIEIFGDGTIVYEGIANVTVGGERRSAMPQSALRELFDQFRAGEFYWLLDEYQGRGLHYSVTELSISFDGQTKVVRDINGRRAGMPAIMSEIASAIDVVVDSERWVRFNDNTLPSLFGDGWDPSLPSEENRTFLARAISHGARGSQISEIIATGVSLDQATENPAGFVDDNWTPLVLAAKNDDFVGVEALLDAGAARNDPTQKSKAMQWALENGNLELFHLSLRHGADIDYNDGYSDALLWAVSSCDFDVVQEVFRLRPSLNEFESWEAILHSAAGSGLDCEPRDQVLIVSTLIDAGADVHAVGSYGSTVLMSATTNVGVVDILLRAGALVNAQNEFGVTALMNSVTPDVAMRLLQAGANPWLATYEDGYDALEYARRQRRQTVPLIEQWMAEHPRETAPIKTQ